MILSSWNFHILLLTVVDFVVAPPPPAGPAPPPPKKEFPLTWREKTVRSMAPDAYTDQPGKYFNVNVFRSLDLLRWTESKGAKRMALGYNWKEDLRKDFFTSEWRANDDEYVFVGVHHVPVDDTPSTEMPFDRLLRSFEKEGVRTPDRVPPYGATFGPGAYLTHRPATGNWPAAGRICSKLMDPKKTLGRKIGILALNVFVPLSQLQTWMHYDTLAIRDGWFLDSRGQRRTAKGDFADAAMWHLAPYPRIDWGLHDQTALLAVRRPWENGPYIPIEEMTWGPGMGSQVKFVGELSYPPGVIDYCKWVQTGEGQRELEGANARYRKWTSGNVFMPKVERYIKNTRTFNFLMPAIFDLQQLPRQRPFPGGQIWDIITLEGTRRDY